MEKLSGNYEKNVAFLHEAFRVDENFDLVERRLRCGKDELTLFYLDGFVKDGVMQRLMQYFVGLTELPLSSRPAEAFMRAVPHTEVEICGEVRELTRRLLAGETVILGSTFLDEALLVDTRGYPARDTEEPANDRVMQGARDGFVETLLFNTALIRRRLRSPALTMEYVAVGGESGTDVVLCYMADRADLSYVKKLKAKIEGIAPTHLTMGTQSLAESLIRKMWYNPFPKIRTTERPDSAASEVLEGRVLLLCDTSPQVMILPVSIFDFMQESDDYCFPPLTGCYLRLVRHFVFWGSLLLTPLWYFFTLHPDALSPALQFLLPKEAGAVPILLQLLFTEIAIDGLKLASMNTPDILSGAVGIIGGVILSDFAVDVGWLSKEVILYMAFVSIASFTQQNPELGYAFKFVRMITLLLVSLFDGWGLAAGMGLLILLPATNRTVNGNYSYLYPLFPFNARAFSRLFFRLKKEK